MSRVLPTTCRPGVTAVEKVVGAGSRRPRDPLDHAPPSRIVRASVACVLVGSLVLACSGVTALGSLPSEQAGAGDGGDGTATLERDGGPEVKAPTLDAISRLTLAICKNIYRCTHASDEEDALRVMFASPEDCAERIPSLWWPEHHLWGWIARLDKSVAPLVALGKVAVDEAALDGCVAAADQCLPGSEVGLGPCSKIFKGTTAEDAPCTSTEVCRSGLYCKRQTTGSCPGACAPQLPLGSPCTYAPDECQGDDFCTRYDRAPSSVCTATIRTAYTIQDVGLDEACDPSLGSRASPSLFRRCEQGVYCQRDAVGTPYTAYTCRPPIAANAPCNKHFTDVCVPGHLCWGPKGSTTCQRVALGGEGDSCTVEASTSEMIRLCDPWKGWTCFPNDASPMGTCGAGGGSGEPSLRIFDEAACIRGFAPTGPDYRCEPLRPTGEECLGGIECASGFCQAGTCREVSCY